MTRVLTAHESASLSPTLHSTPFLYVPYVSHVVANVCIPICLPLCADPTLTINNLRLVTASVKNWYSLGRYTGGLGVPLAVCDDIRNNSAYQTEEEKKEALLLYYLHNVPMASWLSVAGALHYMKEKTSSQAVKGFLKDTPAGQSSYRDCVCVCTRTHAHACTRTHSILAYIVSLVCAGHHKNVLIAHSLIN